MGYMRHHAIWVTSCFNEQIESAHASATSLFPWVSPISPPTINGYRSFYIPPDGSKEGWTESKQGNISRAAYIDYLISTKYDDGSGPLDWVEIQYGDDDGETCIVNHSDLRTVSENDDGGSAR